MTTRLPTNALPGLTKPYVLREAAVAFLSVLWLGLLLGVSFLATPVKFQAPSLDLPTALEVGRVTFALFSRAEWALGALLLFAAFASPKHRIRVAGVAVLALILFVQALWLLPVLDERVARIVAGEAVPATSHHILYIAADAAKALLLLTLSIGALRMSAAGQEDAQCA